MKRILNIEVNKVAICEIATDRGMNFPEIPIELGNVVDAFMDWFQAVFGNSFEAASEGVLWFLLKVETVLFWVPWWVVLVLIFLTGWRLRSVWAGVTFALLLFLIGAFGYWEFMIYTLAIVLASVFIAIIFGIPIGILASCSRRLEALLKPLLDAMQTMPSFVYLIPAMMLFGMGKVPAVFATIIYAIPPVIRLTNLAIREVPREMVEAAHAFGSTAWQVLRKVQLPQALPTIMTGINQTTMMALSMVVIASMVGAKGLGMEVLNAINKIDIGKGFESGISIVFLAIIIDRLSQGMIEKKRVQNR